MTKRGVLICSALVIVVLGLLHWQNVPRRIRCDDASDYTMRIAIESRNEVPTAAGDYVVTIGTNNTMTVYHVDWAQQCFRWNEILVKQTKLLDAQDVALLMELAREMVPYELSGVMLHSPRAEIELDGAVHIYYWPQLNDYYPYDDMYVPQFAGFLAALVDIAPIDMEFRDW